jgi:drug/metabolite transporter (DMT)-like permease
MAYLAACIFCSAVLYLIFKGFEKYKIDLIQAIVVNYFIAGLLGFVLAEVYHESKSIDYIFNADWFNYSILIGLMFITIFNLMGISSQKSGIALTSVANKMSVILPVIFGFIFLNELVTPLKICGILLALIALYFTTLSTNKTTSKYILFPLIIFFASGLLDILLSYCSRVFIKPGDTVVFTACLFSVAALLGFAFLLILILLGKQKLKGKNIVAGVILGIPNFGSILFVFEGLKATHWDVSVFYPVLNMGVVIMAALFGWVFFKEKLSTINIIGIILAAASIYLISF